MRRYWYIVWRRRFSKTVRWDVIDVNPAERLIAEVSQYIGDAGCPIIVNQFEISAEEYQRLEGLQ